MKHVTGIRHSPTGQAIVERAHRVLNEYLIKQKEKDSLAPFQRLNKVLFTVNYLCLTEGREELPVVIHHAMVKAGHPLSLPGL
ncbi:IGEB protein, partial [Centropus bengalensis]|nr:IGEB protein [Centropus bengalensis]